MNINERFDEKMLMAWTEIDSINWRTIVFELADVFFVESHNQVQELQLAWKKRDLKSLNRLAHSLKSSCGNIGAIRAQKFFAEIEILSSQIALQELKTFEKDMKQINEIYSEARADLENFISELQAAREPESLRSGS